MGKAGFKVFKFAMKRCPNQDPAPWITEKEPSEDEDEASSEPEGDEKKDTQESIAVSSESSHQ